MRLRAATSVLALVATTAVTLTSAAQPGGGARQPDAPAPPPAPAPSVVTPPVLKVDQGAKYPKQAIDDRVKDPVEVVLVLEVDATGTVTNAVVETPAGHGFDEAALEAAKQLEFEPAKRNGQGIAVKIRHKYAFAPPPAQLVGKVTTQLRDTAIAGATVTVTSAADGRTWEAIAKEDGSWRIEGVPAGAYKVTVVAPGFTQQTYDETLDPGTEAQVDVRLERVQVVAPPPPPPGVSAEDVEEVTVRGTRPPREVTKRTLEQRELSRIPGTNGDALRAIQNMPGVARAPGLAGLLIVRGAAPQETGTYVDGTFVPIIYHFGGLSSVIPTEMLDRLDFYPGNFSTYFGRHTGGVIDVGVKDPQVKKNPNAHLRAAREGIHGLVQADLIDARTVVQGPIGDTGWKFAVAGRRSYVDVWLKPALEQLGSGVTTAPVYYDYQAMLQRDWGGKRKHSVRFFFFGSDDRLEILVKQVAGSAPGLTGSVGLGTAFYRMQARYVGQLSDDTELRVVGAVGKDAIEFNLGSNYFLLSSYPISSRVELGQRVAAGVRNNLGIDILLQPYDVDVRLPPIPRPGEPPAGPFGSRPPLTFTDSGSLYRPALYDEVELTPFKGTRIVPGVRLDYTRENRSWDLQPRVVARQDLTSGFPRTTLKGGLGRFANPPQPQDTTRVFGVPGTRSIIANHYGFGAEQEITKQIEVSSEAFYRQYDGIIVPQQGNTGEGRAFGLETLLRYKPDAKFFGFLAYTLSRSVRREAPGEPEHLFQFDQTHILTAIGSYRLGRGWEVGARFRLVSGNLRTPLAYGFYDNNVGAYVPSQSFPPFSTRNPMFHQLDIRIDKTWYFDEGVKMSAYLDLYNAYNQGNVEGVSYNYNSTLSTYATGIPILPSLGLRLEM